MFVFFKMSNAVYYIPCIICRAGISPFVSARSVLEPLKDCDKIGEGNDLLQLCHSLQMEVLQLKYGNSTHGIVFCSLYCVGINIGLIHKALLVKL